MIETLSIILGVLAVLFVCCLGIDIVEFVGFSIKTNRFRIIEINGRFFIQRRILKIYGKFWVFNSYSEYSGFTINSSFNNHLRYEEAKKYGFNTKDEAVQNVNFMLSILNNNKNREVVFDTKTAITPLEERKIKLVDKMVKAETNGDAEQVELLVKELVALQK